METTLLALAVELEADTSRLDQGMDGAVARAQRGGGRAGSAFALGFSNPVLNAIGSINQVLQGAGDIARFGGQVSGMAAAAELGAYRRQLTSIAGDANIANAAVKSFQKTAGESNFDTDQVFSMGIKIAGKTGDVNGAVADVKSMLDAAQVFGVRNQNFGQYETNLGQIRNRGANKIERPDYEQFMNYAPLAATKIAQAMGISTAEAAKKLRNATGDQLMDMIHKVANANQGAARAAAGSDPFAVAANIADGAKNAIAPTGELLNRALTPVLQTVQQLLGPLQSFNEATGGGAGLAFVVLLGYRAVTTFSSGARQAWSTTSGLANAMRDLSSAEQSATVATRSAAGAARTGGGIGGAIGRFGPSAIGGAAMMAGSAMEQNHISGGNFVSQMGTGAMLGAEIGSIVPGLGTAIGAAVGAGIGAVTAAFPKFTSAVDSSFGAGTSARWESTGLKALIGPLSFIPALSKGIDDLTGNNGKKGETALDKNTKALEKTAQSMEQMTTKMLGGGNRARAAGASLEAEYALAHLMGTAK